MAAVNGASLLSLAATSSVNSQQGGAADASVDNMVRSVRLCIESRGLTFYENGTEAAAAMTPAEVEAYTVALVGGDGVQGCLDQPVQLAQQESVERKQRIDQSNEYFETRMASPGYQDAITRWRSCMQSRGYIYATPEAADKATSTVLYVPSSPREGATTDELLDHRDDVNRNLEQREQTRQRVLSASSTCERESDLSVIRGEIIDEYRATKGD